MEAKPTEQKGEVLTVEELSHFLRLGRTTTFRLLAAGEIPSLTIGRRRLVRRRDAELYIAERVKAQR